MVVAYCLNKLLRESLDKLRVPLPLTNFNRRSELPINADCAYALTDPTLRNIDAT
jgi:hypothetical protein